MTTFVFQGQKVIAGSIRNWTNESQQRRARFETEAGDTFMFGATNGKLWVQAIDDSEGGENKMVDLSKLSDTYTSELAAIRKYDTASAACDEVFGEDVQAEEVDQL
jgi:hypothetical protein